MMNLKRCNFICYLFVTIGGQALIVPSARACAFEKFGDSPHLRITRSSWVVDTWGQGFGFGVSGGMEIRAVNEDTQESKTIATLSEFTDVTVSSDKPHSLTVTLPNLIDIADAVAQFADVKVIYKFTPYNDPEARANFQKWKRHPDDPQGRQWACHNIYAKMDQINGRSWNQFFTERFGANLAPGETYCSKN